MTPENQYTIEDGAYALDGGSIYLSLRDADGVQHTLVLAQHRIPKNEADPRNPGRLYLDDQIIGIRSEEEARLIPEIKMATISLAHIERPAPKEETGPGVVIGEDIEDFLSATKVSPEAAIRHLVVSLVEFVESEEYVKLADWFADDDSA
jgi:hypothetical protein